MINDPQYFLMSPEQRKELELLLEKFNQDTSNNKRLYEVSITPHILKSFQSQSLTNVICVERKVLKKVKDSWLAEQVIKNSFGSKLVELVPKEKGDASKPM